MIVIALVSCALIEPSSGNTYWSRESLTQAATRVSFAWFCQKAADSQGACIEEWIGYRAHNAILVPSFVL